MGHHWNDEPMPVHDWTRVTTEERPGKSLSMAEGSVHVAVVRRHVGHRQRLARIGKPQYAPERGANRERTMVVSKEMIGEVPNIQIRPCPSRVQRNKPGHSSYCAGIRATATYFLKN